MGPRDTLSLQVPEPLGLPQAPEAVEHDTRGQRYPHPEQRQV